MIYQFLLLFIAFNQLLHVFFFLRQLLFELLNLQKQLYFEYFLKGHAFYRTSIHFFLIDLIKFSFLTNLSDEFLINLFQFFVFLSHIFDLFAYKFLCTLFFRQIYDIYSRIYPQSHLRKQFYILALRNFSLISVMQYISWWQTLKAKLYFAFG